MKPHDFQAADVEYLRENNYTGLLNIEPGGGKTALSLFAAKDSGASTILVVAPPSTFGTAWKPTVETILGVEAREIGNKNKGAKRALSDLEFGYPGVYLTSPQFLTRGDISEWSLEVVAAIYESMASGREVSLPLKIVHSRLGRG